MPGYLPVMICLFKSSPFGPPAISTNVGSQSSEAKMSLKMVPGLITPGQRITHGARIPPSQVLNFPPLNGVVPPLWTSSTATIPRRLHFPFLFLGFWFCQFGGNSQAHKTNQFCDSLGFRNVTHVQRVSLRCR